MTQPGVSSANVARGEDWIAREIADIKRRLRHLASGLGAAPADEYPWSAEGVLAVETGQHSIYNDTGITRVILGVRASVGTAPVGADLIVQVNLDGSPILTTGVVIADGDTTALAVPDLASLWATGSRLTVDMTQVGSSTPGSDLTVTVIVS